MKLGQKLKDQHSDDTGEVVRIFANGSVECRTTDGRTFRGGIHAARRPKKPPCKVRVVDRGEVLSGWMAAMRERDGFRITERHPVFGGAVIKHRDVEVMA